MQKENFTVYRWQLEFVSKKHKTPEEIYIFKTKKLLICATSLYCFLYYLY